MNPKALILDGQIAAARAELVDRVKRSPTDISARSLLFQVMLLCGEWDKAGRQLEIAATQKGSPDMNRAVYQQLIQAEKERIAVSRMAQQPTFFPEIPDFSEDFFQAREWLAAGRIDDAADRFARIDATLPVIRGTVNGKPFRGFMETDSTLRYFIEAIEYERYLWVPITSIRELAVTPPTTLIDLIWAKARITTWEGLTMGCFLPVCYPNSFASDDDRIRLGRLTDWKSLGGGFTQAVGQHVYDIGGTDHALYEIQDAVFALADDDRKEPTID